MTYRIKSAAHHATKRADMRHAGEERRACGQGDVAAQTPRRPACGPPSLIWTMNPNLLVVRGSSLTGCRATTEPVPYLAVRYRHM